MRFRDRYEAGRLLGLTLQGLAGPEAIVLALPRGGVPVGHEVARALRAPLDVFLVRKLGFPGHEELAMGAIASGGVRVLNDEILGMMAVDGDVIEATTAREARELLRREQLYRGERPPVAVAGRTVILVDDGIATGSTVRAAIRALRLAGARRIVVAAPVAPRETVEQLAREADHVVVLCAPEPFHAVGLWYEDFSPTSDDEVRALLDEVTARAPAEP